MKIAIYVRVSTLEQAHKGYSIDEQIDKLKSYCKIKNWTVYKVYKEAGASGASLERPALKEMLSDAKTGVFNGVLVYKLDRLSRSQKDTLHIIEDILNKQNIALISLSENFDTSTPFGKATIGILAVFSQLEREQIKERMQLGRVGRARSGKAMAWEDKMFGYKYDKINDTLIINDYEADVVRKMFDAFLSGASASKIKRDLNEAGGYGKNKWHYNSVRRILSNSIYCGYNEYLGKQYKGNHDPIISLETYEKAQIELDKRTIQNAKEKNPRPFQSKYMVSGLVYCNKCGSRLTTHVAKTKSGNSVRYQCAKRKPSRIVNPEKDCESGFYYIEDLENAVMTELKKITLDRPKESIDHHSSNKEALVKRIDAIERQINKLSDLYMADLINVDELKLKADVLKKERATALKRLESEPKPNKAIELLNRNLDLDKMEYDEIKYFCNVLISRINVDAKGITVKWNF